MSASGCGTRLPSEPVNALCVLYPDFDRPAVNIRISELISALEESLEQPVDGEIVERALSDTIEEALRLEALREEVCF